MSTVIGGVERTHMVLDDVLAERNRQDAKWGDQSGSPDGTGPYSRPLKGMGYVDPDHYAKALAERATSQTDREARQPGGATMSSILLEEVFEALAEDEADKLRAELIQVAAVAVAWCEYIDKRGANPRPKG